MLVPYNLHMGYTQLCSIFMTMADSPMQHIRTDKYARY